LAKAAAVAPYALFAAIRAAGPPTGGGGPVSVDKTEATSLTDTFAALACNQKGAGQFDNMMHQAQMTVRVILLAERSVYRAASQTGLCGSLSLHRGITGRLDCDGPFHASCRARTVFLTPDS